MISLILYPYNEILLFREKLLVGPTLAKHRSTNRWCYVINRLIMYALK